MHGLIKICIVLFSQNLGPNKTIIKLTPSWTSCRIKAWNYDIFLELVVGRWVGCFPQRKATVFLCRALSTLKYLSVTTVSVLINETQITIETFALWSLHCLIHIRYCESSCRGRRNGDCFAISPCHWGGGESQVLRNVSQIQSVPEKRHIRISDLQFFGTVLVCNSRLDLWRIQFFLKRVTHSN